MKMSLKNRTSEKIDVMWNDHKGEQVSICTLDIMDDIDLSTFAGHSFLLKIDGDVKAIIINDGNFYHVSYTMREDSQGEIQIIAAEEFDG